MNRQLARAMIALGLALALSGAFIAPAQATSRTVYVNWYGSNTWPVGYSVGFVDQYTGSTFRWGSCHTGYKCVTIRERTVNSSWAAVTYGAVGSYSAGTRVTIYLNPQRRYYSWYKKRSIVTHELGHAMGITWHSAYCSNVMYRYVTCGGRLPTYRFAAPQRSRLYVN